LKLRVLAKALRSPPASEGFFLAEVSLPRPSPPSGQKRTLEIAVGGFKIIQVQVFYTTGVSIFILWHARLYYIQMPPSTIVILVSRLRLGYKGHSVLKATAGIQFIKRAVSRIESSRCRH